MEKLRICESGVMLGVLAGFGGWSSWDWRYGAPMVVVKGVVSVAEVDFSDVESAAAWFKTQNPGVRCTMTSRATLRVLANVGRIEAEHTQRLFKTTLRRTLTSAVRGSGRTADLDWWEVAAHYADRSANSAAQSTYSSALYAASAVDPTALSTAISAAFSATSWDKENLASDLNHHAVWSGVDVPKSNQKAHEDFLVYLAGDPNWQFFHDWYLAMWEGRFEDWDLAIEVAKIADDVWEAGLEDLGAEIERIRRRLKTQVTPRLLRNADDKWEIEPDVGIADEPIEFAISQVEVTLTATLGGNPNNGLIDTSPETILIRSACSDHRDKPSVVAVSFWNACMSLQRNIGDVYPEDRSLVTLKNVLYTSVGELCDQSDIIRNRIAKLAALETRRYPTSQERKDLSQVPQELEDEMTDDALVILKSDVEIVAGTDKPPRMVRARLVNWLTTIGNGIDKAQKNEKRGSWLLKLAGSITGWFFDIDDGSNDSIE